MEPLGSDQLCRDFYHETAANTSALVERIADMVEYGNPVAIQTAYLQLRYCAEPKIALRPPLILGINTG